MAAGCWKHLKEVSQSPKPHYDCLLEMMEAENAHFKTARTSDMRTKCQLCIALRGDSTMRWDISGHVKAIEQAWSDGVAFVVLASQTFLPVGAT